MQSVGGRMTVFFVALVCEFCKYAKIKSPVCGLFYIYTVLFHKVKNMVLVKTPKRRGLILAIIKIAILMSSAI